ncbi:uncharacterized protein LOC144071226 [Stigmatopora argus]
MQADFLPFLLIAVHVSTLECKWRSQDREELQIWSSGSYERMAARRMLYYKQSSHRSARQRFLVVPSVSLKRFLAPLVRRQKRSEEVNPSDPLRSESVPSGSVMDRKDSEHGQPEPEPDQTGAVSKETLSSCDDPLKVLHANGPVSPVKTNIAEQAEQD